MLMPVTWLLLMNHDKPKAHFWEPNIIARTNEAFWYSLTDRASSAQRSVGNHATFAGKIPRKTGQRITLSSKSSLPKLW